MRTNKKSFNKWLSLASVSLLSAITLQAVNSEPVDAVTGEWQQENRIFSSVNEAMSYGQAHANWSQYKQYRVSYVGPRQFVLKWELRTPKKAAVATPSAQPIQMQGTYTVQAGDSLWRISQKCGVSVADLMRWNGVNGQTMLQIGDKLQVTGPVTTPTPARPVKVNTQKAFVRDAHHFDSVQKALDYGKSIFNWRKYRQFYVRQKSSQDFIIDWELKDGGKVQPAVKVQKTSPTSSASLYTVQAGDSLWKISRRYGVSVLDLMAWNKLGDDFMLYPGDHLIVADPATSSSPLQTTSQAPKEEAPSKVTQTPAKEETTPQVETPSSQDEASSQDVAVLSSEEAGKLREKQPTALMSKNFASKEEAIAYGNKHIDTSKYQGFYLVHDANPESYYPESYYIEWQLKVNQPEVHAASGIDLTAIDHGDFSSIAGAWQNDRGETYIFNKAGLVSPHEQVARYAEEGDKGYSYGIIGKGKAHGGAALQILPKGKKSAMGGSTYDRDALVVEQSVSEESHPFYKVF